MISASVHHSTPQIGPPLRVQHTYQEPQDSDLGKVFHASETDCEDAPAKEQSRQPSRRPDVAFHDPIRRHFEHGVRDGEQRHCDSVLEVAHVGLLHQGIASLGVEKFGISDISAVQII